MDALIFARVSQDSSGIGRSVEEQVADGTAWANAEGWRVVRVIRETGSASRFSTRRERVEWVEALRLISAQGIDIILTWENSRATRDLTGFAELRDACARAGVLWGYGRKVYNLAERDDRFRTGLDALLAEDEVARTSERIRRAVLSNATAGRPHGRNLYGYRRVYDPTTRALTAVETSPDTAAVVQEAFQMVLNGSSLYAVAKRLNERGIAPRSSKRVKHREGEGWTPVAVKQMLSTAGYAGLRQFRGEVAGAALWPAIVSVEDWSTVQLILTNRAQPRQFPSELRHLLTGIARCGSPDCGAVLARGRNAKRIRDGDSSTLVHYENYICKDGQHTSIAMKHLDEIVVTRLLARISEPRFVDTFPGSGGAMAAERRRLLLELDEMNVWLEQVRRVAEETRNSDMLRAQERLIRPKREEVLRLLESLNESPLVVQIAEAQDVRGTWEALDLAAQRAVIRSVMTVSVRPAAFRGARGIAQAVERTEIGWVQ